jgi:hypothetical protein
MIPILLWALATLDSAFCGYRAAAGQSALIDKRAYYRRALRRGAIAGQGAVAIAGAAIAVALAMAAEPRALWSDLLAVGGRLLQVYLPYAGVLLLAFAVRTAPSVDVRSLTSTLVFGPLTFVRPLVVVAGLVWGVAAAPRPALVAIGTLVGVMMLSLETFLGRPRSAPGP